MVTERRLEAATIDGICSAYVVHMQCICSACSDCRFVGDHKLLIMLVGIDLSPSLVPSLR